MTQEDKELLLKDISARLPYGLILSGIAKHNVKITTNNTWVYFGASDEAKEHIKPYLRPMSSMTKEEEMEYSCFVFKEYDGYLNDDTPDFTGNHYVYIEDINLFIDWLNKNHFDYRGLIERGLAIEVTRENNPYET